MGFSPTRRRRDSPRGDLALLLVALVVIGGLLAWGFGIV